MPFYGVQHLHRSWLVLYDLMLAPWPNFVAQQTNCLTELLPEQAIARAHDLDAYLTEHKKPMGPLHGLPISVKAHIGMKGLGL